MSSERPSERSIASKLVWRFAITAAVILCAAMALLYGIVVQHTFEEDNAFLVDKLNAVRAAVRAGDLANAVALPPPAVKLERATYFTRLLDERGGVIVESEGMRDALPARLFVDRESPRNFRAGRLYSLASGVEQTPHGRVTIQLAQDRAEDDLFTKNFALLCVGVLVCGVVACSLVAITVTKRALRPLAEMTGALQRIKPEHFRERVAPSGWPRELQPMASAYDEMQNRLEQSFAKLSQFSADLAHELRTPIANIRGEAEVALTRARTPDEYRQTIESTVAECAALAGIIDNLLFLARAEAAEAMVARTKVDGRAALEKIAAYFAAAADERHITIHCSGEGELHCDPVLFRRAVSNLVDNAMRFTPDHGKIEIALERRRGVSEISVRDNGAGIDVQHVDRVFDRFYRADRSRSSAGTGLGLAIVKSIAELHGGTARVDSKREQGASVTITFPDS